MTNIASRVGGYGAANNTEGVAMPKVIQKDEWRTRNPFEPSTGAV